MLGRYAQDICSSTADIIGYDVLITDEKGLIIGASVSERIGTVLTEAPIVMKTKRSYIITDEDASKVDNLKSGVTYPIEDSYGDVIGAMAISGNPDQVNPFALIVKKQAEMFLREKALLKTEMYRERILQAFINDVITLDPRTSNSEELRLRAKGLGYLEKIPYVAIDIGFVSLVVDFKDEDGGLLESRVLSHIRTIFGRKGSLVAAIEENRAIALYPVADKIDVAAVVCLKDIRKKCSILFEVMKRNDIDLKIGVGGIACDLSELSRSYTEAMEVSVKGPIFCPQRKVFMIEDFRLEELVDYSRNYTKEKFIEEKLRPLVGYKGREEMEDTLLRWCICNFSVKDTAESMHIHRNTLRYRLEKLEEIFGFSMRNFTDMIDIYLAIKLERLKSGLS